MAEDESFNERVYAVVRVIPRGMVATYGQVAALIAGAALREAGGVCAAWQSGAGCDPMPPRGVP